MKEYARLSDVSIGVCKSLLERTDSEKSQTMEKVEEVKKTIYRKGNEFKKLIDEYVEDLVKSVGKIEKQQMHGLADAEQVMTKRIEDLEEFRAYLLLIAKYGKGKDILEQTTLVRERKDELVRQDIGDLVRTCFKPWNIALLVGSFSDRKKRELFGTVQKVDVEG